MSRRATMLEWMYSLFMTQNLHKEQRFINKIGKNDLTTVSVQLYLSAFACDCTLNRKRQLMYVYVALRRLCLTILQWKSSKYYIFRVCL